MFSHFLSYTESHELFQVELLLLLVSLIISFLLSSSFPYFVASALCVLATASPLIYEQFQHVSGPYTYLEATTTLTLAILLLGTFAFTIRRRVSNIELRWHVITALGCWSYLALRAVWIWEDTARPIVREVGSYTFV